MSDIAKRLREAVDHSEHWSDDYHQDESLWTIAREAADEIERQQDLITEFRKRDDVATRVIKNLCDERDHWKALWQGTVEDSTKVIQERDEALREVEALKKRVIPETVTRIDMIDPKRQEHWSDYWSVSIQDEGRTLKLFAEGDGSAAREERDAALAKTISEDLRRLRGTNE